MSKPLSVDLRERVISAIDNGLSTTEATKIFKVCIQTVYNWLGLRAATKSLHPKSGYQKGHSHKIVDWKKFEIFIKDNHGITTEDMVKKWYDTEGQIISTSTLQRGLKKIGYSFKKKLSITSKLTKLKEINILKR